MITLPTSSAMPLKAAGYASAITAKLANVGLSSGAVLRVSAVRQVESYNVANPMLLRSLGVSCTKLKTLGKNCGTIRHRTAHAPLATLLKTTLSSIKAGPKSLEDRRLHYRI
jgi:hypothetical protein